ncbi:hypothetical protein CEXT_134981 [Caerostris extrusa]|uniref:Uncharacterized protein n=1 Tax=Caerostris extrusa TaxID=172846 RepID=A0AAV4W4G3_CAEEX|nr:hypothetical protein CEXT_134981 [Caerostris extrusa]
MVGIIKRLFSYSVLSPVVESFSEQRDKFVILRLCRTKRGEALFVDWKGPSENYWRIRATGEALDLAPRELGEQNLLYRGQILQSLEEPNSCRRMAAISGLGQKGIKFTERQFTNGSERKRSDLFCHQVSFYTGISFPAKFFVGTSIHCSWFWDT